MSYTMTMEPEVEREAATYATARGFTMEQLMRYCIEKVVREELRNRAEHERMVAAKRVELANLARKYSKRVDVPYKFNRADAYPEGEFA